MNCKIAGILGIKAVENLWQFECGTRIFSGSNALENLKALNAQRIFIVSDPFFSKNGTAQQLAALCDADGVYIFDRIMPDPTVELIAQGAALVREFAPDAIAALGGGSAMDCAKALKYFGAPDARLIAIPTTSGSGSEVTDFAILTHGSVKYPLISEKLRPDWAILCSALVEKLPDTLVADGGFDVLAHALEAIAATNASPISDSLATFAFSNAFAGLPGSFDGDRSLRQQVHEASTMAGLAFTHAGLGICHALSHSLGGQFHIPHGRLNAILLPTVVERNAPYAGHKYAQISRAAGLGGASENMAVRNLKNGLCRLRRYLKLPETLLQAGIDTNQLRQNLDALVQAAMEDPCCKTNPAPVDASMLRRLLQEVAGHG